MENDTEKEGEAIKKTPTAGGARQGAGRKAGTGTPSENRVIRVPLSILQEVEDKKAEIKKLKLDLTKLMISGIKKELKKIPYPEGFVQPVKQDKK